MKRVHLIILALLFSYSLQSQITVSPVLGSQELAILPFDYAQDSSHIPISDINLGFFTSPNSIKAFYNEVSYGKMTINGIIYPYRTNQPPLYGTGYTNCYPEDSVIANQPDVDYSIIDGIIILPHDTATGSSCSAGVSSFSKLPFNTPDGNFQFRRSGFRTDFYFPNDFSNTTSSTIAHELLHSFGNAFHSNSYVKDSGDWVVQGYGNVFDILGLRSQASHPCSMIKHKLGWLTNNEIQYVTQTDTFRIYPLEQTLPGQTQCLIIELPNNFDIQPNDNFVFDRLYLEYRGLTGFDSRTNIQRRVMLKDGSYYALDSLHGLSIIGVDCISSSDCMPMLIDTHPDPMGGLGANYFPHEASDAPLRLGETFNVGNNPIDIKVINVSEGNYIDVVISMSGTSSIRNNDLSKIKIYPSPVQNFINIENAEDKNYTFQLYDMNGKLIISSTNNKILDVSSLTKGIYNLIIIDNDSNYRIAKRIVKM